jgi:hypothetical protein
VTPSCTEPDLRTRQELARVRPTRRARLGDRGQPGTDHGRPRRRHRAARKRGRVFGQALTSGPASRQEAAPGW